jgi:hypothetical protein
MPVFVSAVTRACWPPEPAVHAVTLIASPVIWMPFPVSIAIPPSLCDLEYVCRALTTA